MKCALSFCIAAAVLCAASLTCLLALSVTGKLVPMKPPDAVGSGSSLQLTDEESLWHVPSVEPSLSPTLFSGQPPSFRKSFKPSTIPVSRPSAVLTTLNPTTTPSQSPTYLPPSFMPSPVPSARPSLYTVSYQPGNLTEFKLNMYLSKGLQVREVATTNKKVRYSNGRLSDFTFHGNPDFGATFALDDGGWIYVSNSEVKEKGKGGVGALRFDKNGNILSYNMILTGTTMNCGGGRTPWGSWISGEEILADGQAFQVDVQGLRPSLPIAMGRGRFESFSFDVRDKYYPRFFLTEDHVRGTIRRFTPFSPDWSNPWNMLHGNGTLEYLVLDYESSIFFWTSNISLGRMSAEKYYPECEGIDVNNGILYMVAKRIKQLFILDLDARSYINMTTQDGVFDGGPDQVVMLDDITVDILYFTEEGGKLPGVHGRNSEGRFFTILEGQYKDETTGLSFSPNGMFMYFAFQHTGHLIEVSREDGMPFYGRSLNIKYHNLAIAASTRI